MKHKHVEGFRTRHGAMIYYFRPRKGARVRIGVDPEHPDFDRQYQSAVIEWHARRDHSLSEDERRVVDNVIADRVKNALSRDRKLGRVSGITAQWAIEKLTEQDYRCAVTGISFLAFEKKGRVDPYHPSLDRIDNGRGYETDNVRIVLFAVNMMMLDWGDDVFDHVANAYVRRHLPQTFWESPQTLLKTKGK